MSCLDKLEDIEDTLKNLETTPTGGGSPSITFQRYRAGYWYVTPYMQKTNWQSNTLAIYATSFSVAYEESIDISHLGICVNNVQGSPGFSSGIWGAIYDDGGGYPGSLLIAAATRMDWVATVGSETTVACEITLSQGNYWIVGISDGTFISGSDRIGLVGLSAGVIAPPLASPILADIISSASSGFNQPGVHAVGLSSTTMPDPFPEDAHFAPDCPAVFVKVAAVT